MRLIGYVRVSTDDQVADGHSLDQQPERLRAYCEQNGHQLLDVITDKGVSASVPIRRRAGGAQVLEALKAPDVDGVIVIRLDRLFRSALDGMEFLYRTLPKLRKKVVSLGEPLLDPTTPLGKMTVGMALLAAEYDRDLDVVRATECQDALRASGKVYGTVPYGCTAVDGKLYRVPTFWAIRDMIVRNLRNGTSVRIQQAALADANVRSPTGKARWSVNTLWSLQHHHDELARLPFVTQGAPAVAPTHETGVSSGIRLN